MRSAELGFSLGPTVALSLDGRFSKALSFSSAELCALGSVVDDLTRSIPLRDLLALGQLHASADLLVISGNSGRSVMVPIRHVVEDAAASLVFAAIERSADSAAGGPIRLDVPDWITDDRQGSVRSICATTFRDVVS